MQTKSADSLATVCESSIGLFLLPRRTDGFRAELSVSRAPPGGVRSYSGPTLCACGCRVGAIGVRVRVMRLRRLVMYTIQYCIIYDIIAGHRCSQTPTVIRNDSRAVAKDRQDGRRRSAASDCGGRRCRLRRRRRRWRSAGDSRWASRIRRRCRHRLLRRRRPRRRSAVSGGGTPRPRPPSLPSWTCRPRRRPRRRTSTT